MKVNNVLDVIGNTPLVKLNKIFGRCRSVDETRTPKSWWKHQRQNCSCDDRNGGKRRKN